MWLSIVRRKKRKAKKNFQLLNGQFEITCYHYLSLKIIQLQHWYQHLWPNLVNMCAELSYKNRKAWEYQKYTQIQTLFIHNWVYTLNPSSSHTSSAFSLSLSLSLSRSRSLGSPFSKHSAQATLLNFASLIIFKSQLALFLNTLPD